MDEYFPSPNKQLSLADKNEEIQGVLVPPLQCICNLCDFNYLNSCCRFEFLDLYCFEV